MIVFFATQSTKNEYPSYFKDFKDRKLCTEIVPLILPVFWIIYFQLEERIISPNNR